MAKFHVTYKWPEYDEGIREAKRTIPAGDVERVCDKFDIGEYVTLELDTVAMTCVLVPERGRMESDKYYADLTAEWQEEKDQEKAEEEAFNKALRDARREEKESGVKHPEVSRSILTSSSWHRTERSGNVQRLIAKRLDSNRAGMVS